MCGHDRRTTQHTAVQYGCIYLKQGGMYNFYFCKNSFAMVCIYMLFTVNKHVHSHGSSFQWTDMHVAYPRVKINEFSKYLSTNLSLYVRNVTFQIHLNYSPLNIYRII